MRVRYWGSYTYGYRVQSTERFPCSFLLRPTGINDSLGSWILDLVSKYVTTSLKTDHRPKREGGVRFTVESQREQETHKVDERGKLTRYFRRAP